MIGYTAVPIASATTVAVIELAQASSASSAPENLLIQFGGVGAALTVGLWFIRRSDRRDAELEARSKDELQREQDEHTDTRRRLLEALADNHTKEK